MKKKILIVSILVIAAVGIALTLQWIKSGEDSGESFFANLPIIGCDQVVLVQGDSMAPAIKNGERVTLNKCVENKAEIEPGTIVLFDDRGSQRIGRIMEKGTDENGVYYQISQDGRPEQVFTARPDRIKAVKE
ncbi:hypothetical protein A2890_02070 [candidate division WWE3 bacterium RIFCSPLOWO2_01_FULL_53_14]|uniref:Peptidase S24/S26A/S26B/S26C domain-containing protein n=1 Tax=candidate division WWE3 bacterium RIFCSPLOWO2_01_FULL_53_14 TaxID=1802628 RepID=A0A1F4VRL0_UNCKA|nr:MAG: hypothetical protein A2890_02070 [candidate division WWE3 bacterium RIFCSPLOWO2_01_FULL_53_14]